MKRGTGRLTAMTMRTLRLSLLISAWMVACLRVPSASATQQSPSASSDAAVAAPATAQALPAGLAGRLGRTGIGPIYGPRRPEVLYVGEPAEFVVEVSTKSRTAEPIRLPRPADALVEDGTWVLRERAKEGGKNVKILLQRLGPTGKAKRDTVTAERSIGFKFDVPVVREPGKYRLDFKPLGSSSAVATVEFEVVRPTTTEEQMEWHRRKGMRLSWAGKYEEAKREFQALLKLNPNSASAYAQLSMITEGQGRLREAAGYLEKAIALAQAHADPYSNLTPNGEEDWAGYLRSQLRRLNEKMVRDGKPGN